MSTTTVVLNLYRRHTQSCVHGYDKNERLRRPATKGERKRDCGCPISAEGRLKDGPIQNQSTRKTTWEEAEIVARQWEAWGSPTEPEREQLIPTVSAAASAFLDHKRGLVETSTLRAFSVLLNQRLIPFANSTNHSRINAFDLNLTTRFVGSWVNLSDREPLKDTSRKAELERLRAFFRFCVARKWMTENPAVSKDLAVKTKTVKKFGFEPNDERRVFDAILKFRDQHGEIGQANAEELYTFCLVMRVAGLRIHDATTLRRSQIVPRHSGNGWAIHTIQKKTDEYVYIPITDELYERLNKLSYKDGQQHWFWTGVGSVTTAKNNWYRKIMKVFDAVNLQSTFAHPATPHTFRHTFSIRHLNAGTNIKFVSRWLGHQSISITEKHYAHAVRETMVASENAFDESLRKQIQS